MQVLDLIRYDAVRDCFVLRGTPMHKWPDGTPKSMNNAFNWRTSAATTTPKRQAANARSKDLDSNGSIYTYSHTASTKKPYGRTKKFVDLNSKI